MISMTFKQFYARVSALIASKIGVGLESLADVDLWDYYSDEPEDEDFWNSAIREAAEFAVSEQDDMPRELIDLF